MAINGIKYANLSVVGGGRDEVTARILKQLCSNYCGQSFGITTKVSI
jgi:hypothetical protein